MRCSRPRHRVHVEAQLVVLSAGAINSPQILLNSEIANRSGQVGRNLHLHPSILLAGIYDEDIYGYRGVPQSYYVDEFINLEKDPDSGYILMPVYGFPVATASQLPGFGREHWEVMRNYHRMVGLLVLMHDQSAGVVRGRSRRQAGDHLPREPQGAAAVRRRHEALRRDPLRQRRQAGDGAVRVDC